MDERALLRRISTDPLRCGGRPCIRGHRITVEQILDLLASKISPEDICRDWFPSLTLQDVYACIAYASHAVHSEELTAAKR